MLTQIELGQANPSLASIDRIAHALAVSFADLALGDTGLGDSAPAGPTAFTPAAVEGSLKDSADPTSTHALAWEGSHGSTAYILGASTGAGTELWRWHLGPSVHYQAEVDRAGAEEILHVLSGVLGLEHSGETVELTAGMSTRIATDQAYSYTATGETPVDFVRVSIGA